MADPYNDHPQHAPVGIGDVVWGSQGGSLPMWLPASGVGSGTSSSFLSSLPLYKPSGDASGAEDAGQINALIASEGGVQLGRTMDGTQFYVDTPILLTEDSMAIVGAGAGVPFNPSGGFRGPTVIHPTNAAAFSGSGVVVARQATPTRSLLGVTISGFTIAGYALAAGVHGIVAEIQSSLVSRIWTGGVPGVSFYFDGHATDGWNNNIELNYAETPGQGGFYFSPTGAPDNRLSRNTILSSSGYGISAAAPGISILDNFILDSDLNAILGDIYETKIWNNRIEDANGGIYLSGSSAYGDFSIVGNKIWNCSKDTDNTSDSVNITASAVVHGGIIAGNSFYTNEGLSNGGVTGAKNRARYHVNIASADVNDVVLGPNSYKGFNNAVSSFGTAAYIDSGTDTRNFDALIP